MSIASQATRSARELPPFTGAEFEQRVERARRAMTRARLDALLLTAEANVEYLSGFTTRFAWSTPTRPWYFVLPRRGDAFAVIPEIGERTWRETSWVDEVRTWPSPRPRDEGLELLGAALAALPTRYGRIGAELGPESRLGMPVADLLRLRDGLRGFELADAAPLLATLRMVKSAAEIARIRRACRAVGEAFAALPAWFTPGMSERDTVRAFQADILARGADDIPFCAIGSGPGGYRSIIGAPDARRLRRGDLFLIDTGSRYGGYYCDFDRNFTLGPASDQARRVHDALWLATRAGIRAARPGARARDLFAAQARVLESAGVAFGNVGRLGHGLGKVLTEAPSNRADDRTVLRPGMVMTIEPSATYGDGLTLVHEENIVITEDRPRLLSPRAPREMVVLEV